MGWDDQMKKDGRIRGIQRVDQVHVRAGEDEKKKDDQIGGIQLTKFTYTLGRMKQDDQITGIQTIDTYVLERMRQDDQIRVRQLTKSTYWLKTEEGEGMGWSDEGYSKIEQVHIHPGEDGMIR